jgi:hypothetical protein
MESGVSFQDCPRCKYVRAQKSVSDNKAYEHFVCHRCGYVKITNDGEEEIHNGLGSWMFVIDRGIGASAVYIDKDFPSKIDELKKSFQGGKLFYTKKDSIGGYLLVDTDTGMKYPFGDDDEVCFEGLRKLTSIN